jgi:dTDP-4-dehydrorhamnose reductase
MKLFITGSEGMLGSSLCPTLLNRQHMVVRSDLEPQSTGCAQVDVRDRIAIRSAIEHHHPDWVLHLAAATDVDRCEEHPDEAYMSNAVGTEWVAMACRDFDVRMLYISTAGVFGGDKESAYVEEDAPNPVNVYGRSKLAGEVIVRQCITRPLIARAGWMVGGVQRDKKFVGKILRLLQERTELSVVTDKIGTPTFAKDFSLGLALLLEQDAEGVFHMANEGVCSRYDVACKIVEYLGRTDVMVHPITSDAFPLPAPRAASEAMANAALARSGIYRMPGWEEALRAYIQEDVKLSCEFSA